MAKYFRVSVKGSMPGGEVWSVNPTFQLAVPAAIGPDEMDDILTAVKAVTVPNELLSLMSGQTKVEGYRVEARNADGTLETVGEATRTTAAPGTGTSAHPYQTSMVISLRTSSASARAKGRLYWPATGVVIDTTSLRPSSTATLNAVLGAKTYFVGIQTAINSAPGFGDTAWCVWSPTSANGTVITSLRAGDVLDVQRRRRDALVENFSTTDIP